MLLNHWRGFPPPWLCWSQLFRSPPEVSFNCQAGKAQWTLWAHSLASTGFSVTEVVAVGPLVPYAHPQKQGKASHTFALVHCLIEAIFVQGEILHVDTGTCLTETVGPCPTVRFFFIATSHQLLKFDEDKHLLQVCLLDLTESKAQAHRYVLVTDWQADEDLSPKQLYVEIPGLILQVKCPCPIWKLSSFLGAHFWELVSIRPPATLWSCSFPQGRFTVQVLITCGDTSSYSC